ncbi:PhzF family phenazine biosynthesis protein [Planctomycetaceae bacterium SH139]
MKSGQRIPLWQVDAFADAPFSGNPAAVCLLDGYPSDGWLQSVAAEMNLSETAFVVPQEPAGNFQLRWFTPAEEVDLCGHATLATAHALLENKLTLPDQPIYFHTRSGELVCERYDGMITLNFPALPVLGKAEEVLANAVRWSLGLTSAEVLLSKFDMLVIVDHAETVKQLAPDFDGIREIETRGVIVTGPSSDAGIDFVSRFFAPRHNINEDPVTGSAHCVLAPYWGAQLGKSRLVGFQASRRGGIVCCELLGERVALSGNAVTVLEGHLLVKQY